MASTTKGIIMKFMKTTIFTLSLAAVFSFNAHADEKSAPAASATANGTPPLVIITPNQKKFQGTGYGARGPISGKAESADKEIKFVDAFGKIGEGQHGTFLKWEPGFKAPVHSHTYDYFAVVLKGKMLNYLEGQRDTAVELPTGSYWFQAGGVRHVTECISKEPCEGFLVQIGGKFDAQL